MEKEHDQVVPEQKTQDKQLDQDPAEEPSTPPPPHPPAAAPAPLSRAVQENVAAAAASAEPEDESATQDDDDEEEVIGEGELYTQEHASAAPGGAQQEDDDGGASGFDKLMSLAEIAETSTPPNGSEEAKKRPRPPNQEMMKMAQQQQARKVMRTSRESAPEMKNPLSENTRFAGSMHPTAAASYGARPAVVSRSNCMRHVAIAYMIYYRQKQQHAAAIAPGQKIPMELDPTFEAKRLKERSEALKRQRTEMASAAAGQVPSQQYMAASGGAPYFGGYAQAAAAAAAAAPYLFAQNPYGGQFMMPPMPPAEIGGQPNPAFIQYQRMFAQMMMTPQFQQGAAQRFMAQGGMPAHMQGQQIPGHQMSHQMSGAGHMPMGAHPSSMGGHSGAMPGHPGGMVPHASGMASQGAMGGPGGPSAAHMVQYMHQMPAMSSHYASAAGSHMTGSQSASSAAGPSHGPSPSSQAGYMTAGGVPPGYPPQYHMAQMGMNPAYGYAYGPGSMPYAQHPGSAGIHHQQTASVSRSSPVESQPEQGESGSSSPSSTQALGPEEKETPKIKASPVHVKTEPPIATAPSSMAHTTPTVQKHEPGSNPTAENPEDV